MYKKQGQEIRSHRIKKHITETFERFTALFLTPKHIL